MKIEKISDKYQTVKKRVVNNKVYKDEKVVFPTKDYKNILIASKKEILYLKKDNNVIYQKYKKDDKVFKGHPLKYNSDYILTERPMDNPILCVYGNNELELCLEFTTAKLPLLNNFGEKGLISLTYFLNDLNVEDSNNLENSDTFLIELYDELSVTSEFIALISNYKLIYLENKGKVIIGNVTETLNEVKNVLNSDNQKLYILRASKEFLTCKEFIFSDKNIVNDININDIKPNYDDILSKNDKVNIQPRSQILKLRKYMY